MRVIKRKHSSVLLEASYCKEPDSQVQPNAQEAEAYTMPAGLCNCHMAWDMPVSSGLVYAISRVKPERKPSHKQELNHHSNACHRNHKFSKSE